MQNRCVDSVMNAVYERRGDGVGDKVLLAISLPSCTTDLKGCRIVPPELWQLSKGCIRLRTAISLLLISLFSASTISFWRMTFWRS